MTYSSPSSRARMETFIGLVLLSVVLLIQEMPMPASLSQKSSSSAGAPKSTTNSWLSAGNSAKGKCSEENVQELSALDQTDCHVRHDYAVCRATALPMMNNDYDYDNKNKKKTNKNGDDTTTTEWWPIPYNCAGPSYDAFDAKLRDYLETVKEHGPTWGRRVFGLPAHSRVLFFGNTHTAQMATALACQQYTGNVSGDEQQQIQQIVVTDAETQTTRIDFTNNSTLIILTDPRLELSDDWSDELSQDTGGWSLTDFDALILGLFNDCTAELKSQAYECESMTSVMYRQVADAYGTRGPILFVSEMAATRSDESTAVRDLIRYYRDVLKQRNMWFIHGRRYISKISLEGAANYTAKDRYSFRNANNTMDALNEGSLARALPRCQGEYGGHADLLAWDVTEFLYTQLVK